MIKFIVVSVLLLLLVVAIGLNFRSKSTKGQVAKPADADANVISKEASDKSKKEEAP